MPSRFIDFQGTPVLEMDFSNLSDPRAVVREVEAARQFVARQPKERRLRVLVNVQGTAWNSEVLQAFRGLAEHDEPWVLASAIIGFNLLMRVTIRSLLLATSRKVALFGDAQAACAWLAQQTVPPQRVPDQS